MSEAEGVANGTFLPFGLYVWVEKLFETTRLGGVVSGASSKITVTVNVPVPTFPAASDAVQVTAVVPTEKLEPEDGEQVGPEVTPMSSDAVTLNVIVLPAELEVEWDVELDGTATVGEVVSPYEI